MYRCRTGSLCCRAEIDRTMQIIYSKKKTKKTKDVEKRKETVLASKVYEIWNVRYPVLVVLTFFPSPASSRERSDPREFADSITSLLQWFFVNDPPAGSFHHHHVSADFCSLWSDATNQPLPVLLTDPFSPSSLQSKPSV